MPLSPAAHVWPVDDAFTFEATPFGDVLNAYLPTAMWVSQSIAHPTIAASYSSTIAASELTDAFIAPGVFAGTPMSDRSGYLWRSYYGSPAEQVVELDFHARVLTGNGHNPDRMLDCVWTCARVSGGTYSSGTNSYASVDDGYFFGFLSSSALEASWYLLRANSGTLTVLASAVFAGDGTVTDTFDPVQTSQLRLLVEDDGATVSLTCGYRVAGPGGLGAVVEVFAVDDSSASRITADGRAGFIINGRKNVTGAPGGQVAPQVTRFAVFADGVVQVQDVFERTWRAAGTATSTTVGPNTWTGNSLLSSFVGDFHTIAAFDKKLAACPLSGLEARLAILPATAPPGTSAAPFAGGFLASQRPASDATSQHRGLRVRFSSLDAAGSSGASNATPARAVGIAVRISGATAPAMGWTPDSGYVLLAVRDDATPTTYLALARYDSGALVTLASKVPFTLDLDTDYDLELDCYNVFDSAGNPTGPVILRVFVDSAQVVLDEAGAPGVTVDASGTVQDASSNRVAAGQMEAMYAYVPGGDKLVVLDTWEELTLTNSLVGTEVDQESADFDSEVAQFSGETLALPIDWGVELQPTRMVDSARMESGHRRLGLREHRRRRAWTVTAAGMTDGDRDDLRDFFDDHEGCVIGFNWTPPRFATGGGVAAVAGQSVKVHFVESDLARRLSARGVTSVQFQLEELRDG